MVTTSGFIVLDEKFFHSFPADLSSYRSCFRGVLIPRIQDSHGMDSIYIIFPKNFPYPFEEADEKSREKISCIPFDGDDSLAKILEIVRNNTADEIVFISPKNLFTSPEEIDRLWYKAVDKAIQAGEDFIRYRFAALIIAAEREEKRLARNKRIREWVKKNPEKRAAINKRYYDNNRDYVLWASKHKGLT